MNFKFSAIVLCCNETSSLKLTIKKLFKYKELEEVLIIYPNFVTKSCLYTQEILKKRHKKIKNFLQPKKFPGYGGAIRFGIKKIHKKSKYFVVVDADGETDPKVIKIMIKNFKKNNSIDVVSASRFIKSVYIMNYGLFSNLLTFLFQIMCRILLNSNITDFTVNYRMCKTKVIKKYGFVEFDQSYSLESIIFLINDKKKIFEIPYTWTKRKNGNSQNNLVKKFRYFKPLLRYIYNRSAYKH